MSHAIEDFDLHAGDDKILRVTVYEDDDMTIPADISAATQIRWGMALSATAAALFTKTMSGGQIAFTDTGMDGQFDITLDKADTVNLVPDNYYHESDITIAGREDTILAGTIPLLPSILN
jgi:cupin superfamily acireductone dioxygenase involved in methionine salvage